MKAKLNILFFGDSITWCQKDRGGGRAPISERWTTIVARELSNFQCSFYGVPGMAVDAKPWGKDDWYTTSKENAFVEKIIRTHQPEVDHIFLYFGTNNYFANFEKPKSADDVVAKIKRLHDSIVKLFNVQVHIVNLQRMHFHNGIFSIESLQAKINKAFANVVPLTEVISHGKDKMHMAPADNKIIAKIIIKYIKKNILPANPLQQVEH